MSTQTQTIQRRYAISIERGSLVRDATIAIFLTCAHPARGIDRCGDCQHNAEQNAYTFLSLLDPTAYVDSVWELA